MTTFLIPDQRSWIKPHFHNIISSAEQLHCLIAEENIEDANIEMAKPYPALVQRHIVLVRAGAVSAKLDWTEKGRRKTGVFSGGDLILNPAGLTTFPRWNTPVKLFLLAIRPESLRESAEQVGAKTDSELIPSYGFRDNLLAQLIQVVVGEFSKASPDLMYAETMAHAAMTHLLKTATDLRSPLKEIRGKLSSHTLNLLIEYVHGNLSKRLSLDELASLAKLSPVHFARLFRQTTGMPPHRWLREQRLNQAENLLKNSILPISQIAIQTGFSDQSHLTRTFRQSRGTTPHEWRIGT